MLTHEQAISYLEGTASAEEARHVAAGFSADANVATQLVALAQYDSILRTLLGGATEVVSVKFSKSHFVV
jgi:hypothetical protein